MSRFVISKTILLGRCSTKALTLSFLIFLTNCPPPNTPIAFPSIITGSPIITGFPDKISRKSTCKILSVTGWY